MGHDEIAAVSISVNAMLDTLAEEQKFAAAYEQERQLNQLKDQFILNVSHELRTPLTEIYGYLELLNAYREQLDDPTQALFISNAMHGCNELMIVTSTFLEAKEAHSEINSPHLESFSLTRLINELLDGLPLQETRDHLIERVIPEEIMVWADQQFVRRVLRNFLSNAFKYTPPGTPVTIQATPSPGKQTIKGQGAYICVKDTGPGIPPAELPLLFQKFIRLKRDLSGPVRGTGLGLYISKQLVEAMNGRIWVESSGVAGEGSRFCFTLPTSMPVEESAQNRGKTIKNVVS